MLTKRFLALDERGVTETRFVLVIMGVLNIAKIVHLEVDWTWWWTVRQLVFCSRSERF